MSSTLLLSCISCVSVGSSPFSPGWKEWRVKKVWYVIDLGSFFGGDGLSFCKNCINCYLSESLTGDTCSGFCEVRPINEEEGFEFRETQGSA